MISLNIHPDGSRWEGDVRVSIYGKGKGNAVVLSLESNTIAIHYGDEQDRYEFVSNLKEAFAGLENPCPTCGECEECCK